MRTGAYCGAVALACFLAGVIVSDNPVAAWYIGLLLSVVAGLVGVVFEDQS